MGPAVRPLGIGVRAGRRRRGVVAQGQVDFWARRQSRRNGGAAGRMSARLDVLQVSSRRLQTQMCNSSAYCAFEHSNGGTASRWDSGCTRASTPSTASRRGGRGPRVRWGSSSTTAATPSTRRSNASSRPRRSTSARAGGPVRPRSPAFVTPDGALSHCEAFVGGCSRFAGRYAGKLLPDDLGRVAHRSAPLSSSGRPSRNADPGYRRNRPSS